MTQEITPARSAELAPLQLPAAQQAPLAELVAVANENEMRAANAGNALIAHSCVVGAAVQAAYEYAAKHGFPVKALFADFSGSSRKVTQHSGGKRFSFTYAHGNSCRKLYLGIYARMVDAGQQDKDTLDRIIADHVAAIVAGAANSVGFAQLFVPYIEAQTMRQQLLLLYPQPAPTAAEVVQPAAAAADLAETPAEKLTRLRAEKLEEFNGYLTVLDNYLNSCVMYVPEEDRIAQAEKLEQAARELRTMKPLPGLSLEA